MYNLNIKNKYKMFYVKFINKDKPDVKYLGMLWTAKTEIAVRVKIKDCVPANFIIKRLVEIDSNIYYRLAKFYNYKEKIREEERKNKSEQDFYGILETFNRINRMIEDGPYKGIF